MIETNLVALSEMAMARFPPRLAAPRPDRRGKERAGGVVAAPDEPLTQPGVA
ncbi:hypothetical protein [Candidatus Chloroploca sp. Khr17]|uniref:hypothetical protein n=1 Tax=Candidatus Chloroploca sp. Khr17 TaxID=2496869 RepID=UPI0013EA42A6|nr:hypothetical protein [Candidatus Chloroploca sp. Khr17]